MHLFCDASSTGQLGAVLFDGKWWHWTSTIVDKQTMEQFRNRSDNQIMGLELLSVSLGLGTFREKLRNRMVVIHSDNSGAEVCPQRGACVCCASLV